MGAIAELIKAAENKEAAGSAATLKQLEALQRRADAIPPASEAFTSLSQKTPTSEEESRRNALKWIAIAGAGGAGLGVLLRTLRAGREAVGRRRLLEEADPYAGMPGREITIPLPKFSEPKEAMAKSAVGMLLPAAIAAATIPTAARAAGSDIGGMWDAAKGGVSRGVEHLFSSTGSPWDSPWFLPAAIGAGLGAGYLGYSQLDKVLEKVRKNRSTRHVEEAKQEFEDALRTQYREADLAEKATKGTRRSGGNDGGFKFSAAGMMGFVADAFAQAHVNGELQEQFNSLEKSALDEEGSSSWTKGLGRKSLGAYLAALALLTVAGGTAGYSYAKSREPERRKHQIAKELLRQRAMSVPPTVSVEAV